MWTRYCGSLSFSLSPPSHLSLLQESRFRITAQMCSDHANGNIDTSQTEPVTAFFTEYCTEYNEYERYCVHRNLNINIFRVILSLAHG